MITAAVRADQFVFTVLISVRVIGGVADYRATFDDMLAVFAKVDAH
jgi:hypothetical protein